MTCYLCHKQLEEGEPVLAYYAAVILAGQEEPPPDPKTMAGPLQYKCGGCCREVLRPYVVGGGADLQRLRELLRGVEIDGREMPE